MSDDISNEIKEVVGLDLGDKKIQVCVLDMGSGEVLEEGKVPTGEMMAAVPVPNTSSSLPSSLALRTSSMVWRPGCCEYGE